MTSNHTGQVHPGTGNRVPTDALPRSPDRAASSHPTGSVRAIRTDLKMRYHQASHTEHSYPPGKRAPLVGHLERVGIVSTTLQ